MLRRRMLLRQTDERPLGRGLYESGSGRNRWHAARNPGPSDAAVRVGRRTPYFDSAARDRAPRTAISGADILAVHDSVWRVAIHHRVLSWRSSRRRLRSLHVSV